MSYYIFKFTKGDSQLQAETQDKELIAREFEKSVTEAFGITCEKSRKSFYKKPLSFDSEKRHYQSNFTRKPTTFSDSLDKKPANQINKEFESFLQKNTQSTEKAVINQPEAEESSLKEEIKSALSDNNEQNMTTSEVASLKSVQPEETIEVPEISDTSEKEKLEVITPEEVTLEEDNISSTNQLEEVVVPEETKDNSFQEVLQQKFIEEDNIQEEITNEEEVEIQSTQEVDTNYKIDGVNSVSDLFELKSPSKMIDYLILTAYYLKYYENSPNCSLKQLNLKVLPVAKVPINHAVIQEALNLNYLEVVPDSSWSAYVSEYTITDNGVKYVVNDL